jgi:hypothetical protein
MRAQEGNSPEKNRHCACLLQAGPELPVFFSSPSLLRRSRLAKWSQSLFDLGLKLSPSLPGRMTRKNRPDITDRIYKSSFSLTLLSRASR